ncbi:MAG: hypothetical protein RLZZ189_432 [Pseudomonadota bacterium]|jgi:hypothetical protein
MATTYATGQAAENKLATYTSGNDDRYVDKHYANVKSDVIEITHDKLENVLLKFYEKRLLLTAWFNPFSVILSVALTLTTAEFKTTVFSVEGPTWKAIFLVALCLSIAWISILLIKLLIYRNETSIESLINRIKNVGEPK